MEKIMITNEILLSEINAKFGQMSRDLLFEEVFNFKNVETNGVVLNGDINFKVFNNSSQRIYSYDNGTEIILLLDSYSPVIPSHLFDAHLSVYNEEDGGVAISFFLKEGVSFPSETGIREDDLRQEMVGGMEALFEKQGMELSEEMECMSAIFTENREFTTYFEFESEVKSIIKELGMGYLTSFEKESFEELEYETKENFLEIINQYSIRELNRFLNSEFYNEEEEE
jgi:hypothetical protein